MGGLRSMVVLFGAALLLHGVDARAATFAYVPGEFSTVVSRIDLATNEALPITVGDGPVGIGASADGATVVVSNSNADTVSVIDGTAATVTWTVPVGSFPRGVGVTPDGSKAYVVNVGSDDISVVDTVAGTVTTTIPVVGSLGSIAMSPSGHRAYVANASFGGTVVVIDTTSDIAVTETLVSTTSFARSTIASPDGTRVYVGLDDAVAVMDATTNLFVDDVTLPGECCTTSVDLTITPDGSKVFVSRFAGTGPGGFAVDTATLEVTPLPTSAPFSQTHGVDVSPDGATLYVLNIDAGTIDLIDVPTMTVRATIGSLAGPPAALGEFIAGPTTPEPPEPPAPPPVLGATAYSCQKAVLNSFKVFAAKSHQLLGACLLRIHKDRAAGPVTSATTNACARDVDPASELSRLAKARASAKKRIVAACTATTAAALGPPCDDAATTIDALAECALDAQLGATTQLLAREVTSPCVLLDLVGLVSAFPELCS